ncbi:MAG TPA: hypothetical protein VKB46_04460 [Pyrinomonadaceae bacterium]|nr:hypothetical protein [Pyrinomonadaceae bacterium]
MKIVYYLGMLFFGFIGIISILRTLELLIVGAGLFLTQLLIGVVMLALAFFCLKKARASVS